MKKEKIAVMILFTSLLLILFFIPNVSNAAVSVSRNVYSNNGSMNFNFTGLNLEAGHEFEFALTKTQEEVAGTWFPITQHTTNTATINVTTTTNELRDVINASDKGYISIRDKSDDNRTIVEDQEVDLKIPFLKVTNYTVIPNGKQFDSFQGNLNIGLRNKENSQAYFQYEKITDTRIINKYKELKESGNYTELQSLLKQNEPQSDWSNWAYWNGYESSGMNGFGYPQGTITAPGTGLYYLWVYFSGTNNIKDIYGYVLVDNLQPDIALEEISLRSTATVELGKTITLTPLFKPEGATNKIVTWHSSEESVATVDNNGKVTPKKVGSTIITVTSQDGTKKANCTVTVVEKGNESTGTPAGQTNGGSAGTGSGSTSASKEQDTTTAKGTLPYAGLGMGLAGIIAIVALGGMYTYYRYKRLKDI